MAQITERMDSAVQAEIANLTNVISARLPSIETATQSNLEELTAASEISQVIADWDLPGQMEGMNRILGFHQIIFGNEVYFLRITEEAIRQIKKETRKNRVFRD